MSLICTRWCSSINEHNTTSLFSIFYCKHTKNTKEGFQLQFINIVSPYFLCSIQMIFHWCLTWMWINDLNLMKILIKVERDVKQHLQQKLHFFPDDSSFSIPICIPWTCGNHLHGLFQSSMLTFMFHIICLITSG